MLLQKQDWNLFGNSLGDYFHWHCALTSDICPEFEQYVFVACFQAFGQHTMGWFWPLSCQHPPCEAFTTRKQQIRWWVGDLRTLKLLSTTCCLNRRTGQVWRFQEQVDCWLCKNCLRLPVLTVLSGYLWVKLGSLECTWMFSQQAPDQCWIICLFNVIFVILYNTLDFIRKLKNYSHLFTGLAV